MSQDRGDGEPDRPCYLVRRFIMDTLVEILELFADLSDRLPRGNVQRDQYSMRRDHVADMSQLFP